MPVPVLADRAVCALRVARRSRFRQPHAVGDAPGIRRPSREAGDAGQLSAATWIFRTPMRSCSSAPPAIWPTSRSFRRCRRWCAAGSWRRRSSVSAVPAGRVEQLIERARASIKEHGVYDEQAFAQAGGADALRRWRLSRGCHFHAAAPGAGRRQARRCTTWRYRPSVFATVVGGLAAAGLRQTMRAWCWRSRSAAILRRRASSTPSCSSTFPRNRSSASITTSARSRCRTSCTRASATPFSSRSGTAPTSAACRSRWPRTSTCAAAASSTRRPAPSAT